MIHEEGKGGQRREEGGGRREEVEAKRPRRFAPAVSRQT